MKNTFKLSAIATLLLVTELPNVAFAEGAVFVQTNHTNMNSIAGSNSVDLNSREPANRVAMYHRVDDGSLTFIGYFATGGQGSGPAQRFAGDGLGSSHSVQLSESREWLFVTNAGSNSVSVLNVKEDGLTLTDVALTGDGSPSQRFPNSVTQKNEFVYVLNSAGNGSITGFTLTKSGKLKPIANSTRSIAANQLRFTPDPINNPAQISFTPNGRQLVVTIKDGPATGIIPGVTATGKGRILVFSVDNNGVPSKRYTQTELNNGGPFGFSFDREGNLLTALFVGGSGLTGAAGSFRIDKNGSLVPITPVVNNTQIDTCWLENNGTYAFGSNYSSGTISSYKIDHGSLTLLDAKAGFTDQPSNSQGSTPLDLGISDDKKYLYDVLPGSGKIAAWGINDNGSLTKIDEYTGIGQTTNGDHAPFDFSPNNSPAGMAVY